MPEERQLKTTADGFLSCPSDSSQMKLKPRPGVYRVGGGVQPPKAVNSPSATFSDEARKEARKYMRKQHLKTFEAVSIVEVTVDEKGKPQDLCIAKEAGYGLDKRAYDAVRMYIFQPATLNGDPVAVRIAVEVAFKLY
jgi:protein TonB